MNVFFLTLDSDIVFIGYCKGGFTMNLHGFHKGETMDKWLLVG